MGLLGVFVDPSYAEAWGYWGVFVVPSYAEASGYGLVRRFL